MWRRIGAPAVGIAIALVITAFAYATTRPDPVPDGKIVAAGCAWHGGDVVVTGAVRNLGSSAADFQVTPTFWIVGLGIRGRHEAAFVHVPAHLRAGVRLHAPRNRAVAVGHAGRPLFPHRAGGRPSRRG